MCDLDDMIEVDMDDDREYSQDEMPVDIGKWQSYMPYHDKEQLEKQLDNLLTLPLRNSYGDVRFVLSKNIARIEEYLKTVSKEISIENTEVVLETEVYYTSKIEGAKTTIKRTQEIHNGSPISTDNEFSESMIKGNFNAVALLNLYGNKIDEDILYKVWDTLTTNCRDNLAIQGERYRKGEVEVSNSDFKAVPPDLIEGCMKELIHFYQSDMMNEHPFIKASIIHYAFETIHPFCDGNGRLGRLLMNNYLIGQGIESSRAVSFSMQIDKNRGLYDGAFEDAENKFGDCTPFVEYMLQTMANAYENIIKG